MGPLHKGQIEFLVSHSSTHATWKWCLHGSSLSSSPSSYLPKQIAHSCKNTQSNNNNSTEYTVHTLQDYTQCPHSMCIARHVTDSRLCTPATTHRATGGLNTLYTVLCITRIGAAHSTCSTGHTSQ